MCKQFKKVSLRITDTHFWKAVRANSSKMQTKKSLRVNLKAQIKLEQGQEEFLIKTNSYILLRPTGTGFKGLRRIGLPCR